MLPILVLHFILDTGNKCSYFTWPHHTKTTVQTFSDRVMEEDPLPLLHPSPPVC